MYNTLDDLKQQNREISDLCDVLSALMKEQSLHSNPYVRELLSRFKEKVWVHLVFEDNTFYAALLHSGDEKISNIAKEFHDSAKEIKHCFSTFVRHWTSIPASEAEHDVLSYECGEIFSLIKNRIAYENEKIFPLVEQLQKVAI